MLVRWATLAKAFILLSCDLTVHGQLEGGAGLGGAIIASSNDVTAIGPAVTLDEPEEGEVLGWQFPNSVNTFYKGEWNVAGNHSTAMSTIFGFDKASGSVWFEIGGRRKSGDTHELQVEMFFRNGGFSHDKVVRLMLQGVYYQPTGSIMLWNYQLDPLLVRRAILSRALEDGSVIVSDSADSVRRRHDAWPIGGLGALFHRSRSTLPDSILAQEACSFSIRLQVDEPEGAQRTADGRLRDSTGNAPLVHVHGDLASPNCGLSLHLNATSIFWEVYHTKAVHYTLMIMGVSFVQVMLMIRQMEYSNTQASAAKVSLLTIGQQAVLDAYLCLLHLTAGIFVEALFNTFATAAFFKFVIFSIFEMRYLLIIWKARRPSGFNEGWSTMRRELSTLYLRFYGFFLMGFFLLYQMQTYAMYFIFITYSFWVPQIVCNIRRDARKSLHPNYIIGISLTRLVVPLYFFACPQNFMRVPPNFNIVVFLLVYMGLQVACLLLQHFFGPRCFIPKQFLPTKYDYHRRLSSNPTAADGTAAELDCVICMSAVVVNDRNRMVTPCDHFFHSQCLLEWMEVKMECPTCRRVIPAP